MHQAECFFFPAAQFDPNNIQADLLRLRPRTSFLFPQFNFQILIDHSFLLTCDATSAWTKNKDRNHQYVDLN